MCPLCVVGPPPFHTVGVCVLCGGVTPVPFHMVGVYLLCLGPPTLQHGVCVCVGVGFPLALPHGGCVSSVLGAPLPFHTVGVWWGPPYTSTQWACILCVCGRVPPALPHGERVPSACGGVPPTLPHSGHFSSGCVVGSPWPFHMVGRCLLCMWWGPPWEAEDWECLSEACGEILIHSNEIKILF